MTRRPLPPARFSGLRDDDLMRIARRVTVLDVIDGAAFVLVALGAVVAMLHVGG